MPGAPDRDLEGLDDREILNLAETVKDTWRERDEMIEKAVELRKQKWNPIVPPAWRQTARVFHSALSREIPARVVGTIASQRLSFDRISPDDDEGVEEQAVSVARWVQGHHQYQARNSLPGKNAYTFALDQLINKGAVCAGSLYSPHAWASVPARFIEGNDITAANWRDDKGQPTEDPEKVDSAASARAYLRQLNDYRKQARPPITRRVLQTEHSYPLFVEGEMLALFIIRPATIFEVQSNGFAVEALGGGGVSGDLGTGVAYGGSGFSYGGLHKHELIEVITANQIRYYYHKQPLKHPQWGERLQTNYGWVPYVYQTGLEGGELEYGNYGHPLLSLVDSNIRMIDTMQTYALNAIHFTSYPSYYVKYDPAGQWNIVEGETGRTMSTFDFKTGTVMDFGPYKEPVQLKHDGLNKDFYQFLQWQVDEVNRIIPRTLQGVAESSGYNTAQSTVQAKAIFWPIADGAEAFLERLAYFDLQHIGKRIPEGQYVYLNLELPRGMSSKPKKTARISICPEDINDYYHISATIDRELDRVTLGQFALNMMNGGVGDDEWVWDMAGGEDYQQMRARRARMQLLNSQTMMQVLEQRAIKRFGLETAAAEAEAAGRIERGPDGTPMVKTKGGMVGPGQNQSAQGQGAAGATFGGTNPKALQGGPNLNSQANPQIALPVPKPKQGEPPRGRRRGGATPGMPQRQPNRPTPQAGIV